MNKQSLFVTGFLFSFVFIILVSTFSVSYWLFFTETGRTILLWSGIVSTVVTGGIWYMLWRSRK